MCLIRWNINSWTEFEYRGTGHTAWMIRYRLAYLLESKFRGLLANLKDTDYREEMGNIKKALIKQETLKSPQHMLGIGELQYEIKLNIGGQRICSNWNILHKSMKESMYQGTRKFKYVTYLNESRPRFYSTTSKKSKLDKDVDLRLKIENYAKLWERAFNNPSKIHYDLKGYLKDENLWIMAYQKIAQNRGSVTAAVDPWDTIDGVNIDKIKRIQRQVLENRYIWKPTLRKYIPKNNGKSLRPLGIPSFSDKLVETVLCMILEPIYEFNFDNRSFGFRAERSAHTALKYIATKCVGARWVIEGDISKCFDKINHDRLLTILEERIKDPIILNLIKGSLNSKIYDEGKLLDSHIGTRQGGSLSPLLCNIYLDKLDKKVRDWEEEILIRNPLGYTLKPNKEYYKFNYQIKRGYIPRNTKNPYPQKDRSRTQYEKIDYVRYADDFILFCDTNLVKAKEYKEKLNKYIKEELNLELNNDKTKITHAKKGYKFLGHTFLRRKARRAFRKNVHSLFILSLSVDISKITKILAGKKFCTLKGFPITYYGYLNRTQLEINKVANMILNGYKEWFKIAKNRQKAIDYVYYIIRFSIAKTYAAKYRLGSIRKVFKIAGSLLNKPLKKDQRTIGVTEEQIEKWAPKIKDTKKREIPAIRRLEYPKFITKVQGYSNTKAIYIKILEKNNRDKLCKWILEGSSEDQHRKLKDPLSKAGWYLQKAILNFRSPCVICGNMENVEMHHVKSINSLKGKNPTTKHVTALKMRQIPLCKKHHLEIGHGGNWKNKPYMIYVKENKIKNDEANIHSIVN